jgi:hypothetical protein
MLVMTYQNALVFYSFPVSQAQNQNARDTISSPSLYLIEEDEQNYNDLRLGNSWASLDQTTYDRKAF